MPQLNFDVIGHIITEICTFDGREKQDTLRSLGTVSRQLCYATRPHLFSSVRWPHPNKHDSDVGLYFFPESLWPYFRTFHLDWPDYWPDLSPPAWGIMHQFGGYIPKHLDKLEQALPSMCRIHTFQMSCPFYPPNSLLLAIFACPTIKDMRVTDTPIKAGLVPSTLPSTFSLDRLTFVPVGETNRVGEGPFEKKYHDIVYYTRSYRKRHSTDTSNGGYFPRIMPGWALLNIFCLAKPDSLKYIQISGSYCSLHDFNGTWWPNLETLVLTGPEAIPDSTNLADVVGRMPKLWDLRVLFHKALASAPRHVLRPCVRIVEPERDADYAARSVQHVSEPTVFSQIKYFAASNVCNLDLAFKYFTSLEGLALIAVINHPRVPIARSKEDIDSLLDELATTGSGQHLKVLRVMIEGGMEPALLSRLGKVCPLLEKLEIEICGYRDTDPDARQDEQPETEWSDYGDALQNLTRIQQLRMGIVFWGHDEVDYDTEVLLQRRDRLECAKYLASRVRALRRIGFEYRMRTGSHRYEDRWLEFDIERLGDERINLSEVGQSWYPFPEVWEHVPLQD